MGAGNAKLAFGHWAGKVPPGSLAVLVFMALVTKDSDESPMFWGGQESIALTVLGRRGEFDSADSRAVERLLTPLFRVGAIATQKHSAPGRRARYTLNLHPSSSPEVRAADLSEGQTQDGIRPPNTRHFPSDEHPTESGQNIPRFPSGESANTRRFPSATPDGNRRGKEQQEYLKQDATRGDRADVHPQRSGDAHPREANGLGQHPHNGDDQTARYAAAKTTLEAIPDRMGELLNAAWTELGDNATATQVAIRAAELARGAA